MVLRTPEGVRRAADAAQAYQARWRKEMGLPPWWRFNLVHMTAKAWLAKHGRWEPEGEGGGRCNAP